MTQKVLIVSLVIWLACSVASILKFMERKQLTIANVLTSLLIPMFLVIFMVDFFGHVYQTDFRLRPLSRRILRSFKFMFIEIQIIPLMHTVLIEAFCSMQAESESLSFNFRNNESVKRALEDLRGIIVIVMAKVAQVRTRKRGKTWSYIFEAGKTADGKRKVIEKGGFPTKEAAYKAGVAAYTDWLHGNIGITSEKITLKDFMTKWLDEVAAVNVKPTTLQKYKSNFVNQIAPYLGDVKVQELTPAMLDNWMRKLLKAGLAKNTLAGTHTLIHSALNYAVYPAQLISSNPAVYIKVPKNAPHNIVKRTIITPEQFAALLKKYPFGTPFHIPLMLLYHTGARLGEVLSLSWSDIDFAAKRIHLHRQILPVSKRGYFFTTLKTESSKRYIIVGDDLLDELSRWQKQQAENEKQCGNSYVCIYREENEHIERRSKSLPAPPNAEKVSLVCIRNNGKWILRESFMNFLRKEGINAHSFRHTHATILAENGATANGVAGRLGHANAAITQNLYIHNTEKLQEEMAAVFIKSSQTIT